MTVGGFIDAVLEHGTDIQGGQNILQLADIRERCLFFLQSGCEWFANFYPFSWRLSEDIITVDPAGYFAPAPADLHHYGPDCIVSRQADHYVMEPRATKEVRQLQRANPSTGLPTIWSPYSISFIDVYPAGASTALNIDNYFRSVATLVDNVTDQIDMIPQHYHRTILFDYVVGRLFFGYGDDRSVEQDARIMAQVRQAVADENLGPVKKRLPRYGRVRGR